MGRLVLSRATVSDLGQIAEWVTAEAVACGFDARIAFKIQMAVDEACSNILTHGYAGGAGRVELETRCERRTFEIHIRDWGRAFDPTAIDEPDLAASVDERNIGGLGLFFMRQFMDDVRFTFDPQGGNLLRMTKRR